MKTKIEVWGRSIMEVFPDGTYIRLARIEKGCDLEAREALVSLIQVEAKPSAERPVPSLQARGEAEPYESSAPKTERSALPLTPKTEERTDWASDLPAWPLS